MSRIFADTQYWVTKIHPQDQWHEKIIELEYELGLFELITSESVLIETLNYFGGFREVVKETAALVVRSLFESEEIEMFRRIRKMSCKPSRFTKKDWTKVTV